MISASRSAMFQSCFCEIIFGLCYVKTADFSMYLYVKRRKGTMNAIFIMASWQIKFLNSRVNCKIYFHLILITTIVKKTLCAMHKLTTSAEKIFFFHLVHNILFHFLNSHFESVTALVYSFFCFIFTVKLK